MRVYLFVRWREVTYAHTSSPFPLTLASSFNRFLFWSGVSRLKRNITTIGAAENGIIQLLQAQVLRPGAWDGRPRGHGCPFPRRGFCVCVQRPDRKGLDTQCKVTHTTPTRTSITVVSVGELYGGRSGRRGDPPCWVTLVVVSVVSRCWWFPLARQWWPFQISLVIHTWLTPGLCAAPSVSHTYTHTSAIRTHTHTHAHTRAISCEMLQVATDFITRK